MTSKSRVVIVLAGLAAVAVASFVLGLQQAHDALRTVASAVWGS